MNSITDLLGKTLTRCKKVGDDEILFETSCGEKYRMWHSQDCCEHVYIEDICGELTDLIGCPILQAEENSNNDMPSGVELEYTPESMTWTFYRISTMKGQVVLRWLGESNGYYSESVSFDKVENF